MALTMMSVTQMMDVIVIAVFIGSSLCCCDVCDGFALRGFEVVLSFVHDSARFLDVSVQVSMLQGYEADFVGL